jgi:hypothetical protein
VPVGPRGVALADLDHREVERPEAVADVAKGGEEPAVAGVVEPVRGSDERDPPQSFASLSKRWRPEACRVRVRTISRSPTRARPHQWSSTICASGIPQREEDRGGDGERGVAEETPEGAKRLRRHRGRSSWRRVPRSLAAGSERANAIIAPAMTLAGSASAGEGDREKAVDLLFPRRLC